MRQLMLTAFAALLSQSIAFAGDVTYRAVQRDKKVTITATGENNTGGWKNELEQLPMEKFPPEFKLVQTPPGGFATQVISPFSVQASFDAAAPVEFVFVTDRGGRHKVAVQK